MAVTPNMTRPMTAVLAFQLPDDTGGAEVFMRLFRLGRWGSQIRPLGCRHCSPFTAQTQVYSIRPRAFATTPLLQDVEAMKKKRGRPRKSETVSMQSSMASPTTAPVAAEVPPPSSPYAGEDSSIQLAESLAAASLSQSPPVSLEQLPSPPLSAALESAKLAALHARLSLSSRFPHETLARTLVHQTADSNPQFNNSSLAVLGSDLLSYYSAENLLAKYPRLPMLVLYAAQYAYVGPRTLAAITQEWGIEAAAEPGGEVDAGLLQFKRALPGAPTNTPTTRHTNRKGQAVAFKRGVTSRIVYDDEFGEMRDVEAEAAATTAHLEEASASFVHALVGAMYLHSGATHTQTFFKDHFLSRHLDLSTLFTFTQPTRDLSRLCAREGFESPIARLESETGRLSRHPVFVVGIYSGSDKLGEGAGSSLNEARFRAAVSALKGWYLYSPPGVILPSEAGQAQKGFKPIMVDYGESKASTHSGDNHRRVAAASLLLIAVQRMWKRRSDSSISKRRLPKQPSIPPHSFRLKDLLTKHFMNLSGKFGPDYAAVGNPLYCTLHHSHGVAYKPVLVDTLAHQAMHILQNPRRPWLILATILTTPIRPTKAQLQFPFSNPFAGASNPLSFASLASTNTTTASETNPNMPRAPVIALSHGGGPMPLLGDPKHAAIAASLRTRVPKLLGLGTPAAPRAIIIVTAHWTTAVPTISSAARPSLYYDYYNFPPEAYKLTYDAPGAPDVAEELRAALALEGLPAKLDAVRGWDHGVFVPMMLIHPAADVPIVQVSVLESEDAAPHFAMGRALAGLRDSGVAVIGSGFPSFHNFRRFFTMEGDKGFRAENDAFSGQLLDAVASESVDEREKKLGGWRKFQSSYEMHPQGGAEHFLPLLVCASAAGDGTVQKYSDEFRGLDMFSYYWQ
ncbi:hypothetical protein FH972_021543 [Carpinus fangiana]|uniref:Large ribosomal subunit protein mL44 n=1 Tax=Carpinus fangiana TaxID=176857 RepID=A0A5N6KPM6_9ROSI|nr:hypothetical protein FH972_021543 [Carpinus fangiana]